MYDPMLVAPLPADYPWEQFASDLITTEDLDGSYLCFARSDLPDDQKKRALLGLMTYYNLGFAAWVSEYSGKDFWTALRSQYPVAPRAPHRRGFWGAAGLSAIDKWESCWPQPESFADELTLCRPDYLSVRAFISTVPQCGDYWQWKLADLYESICGTPVDFSGCEDYASKYPKQGAQMILPGGTTADAFAMVIEATKHLTAPPFHNRAPRTQEAETVCCFMNKLRKGEYIMGQSMADDRNELKMYRSPANDAMEEAMCSLTPMSRDYLDAICRVRNIKSKDLTPC